MIGRMSRLKFTCPFTGWSIAAAMKGRTSTRAMFTLIGDGIPTLLYGHAFLHAILHTEAIMTHSSGQANIDNGGRNVINDAFCLGSRRTTSTFLRAIRA